MQKVLAHLFSQKFLQVFNVHVDDHLQPMYLFIFLVVYFNLLQDSYNASPMSHISIMVWEFGTWWSNRVPLSTGASSRDPSHVCWSRHSSVTPYSLHFVLSSKCLVFYFLMSFLIFISCFLSPVTLQPMHHLLPLVLFPTTLHTLL